MMDDYEDKTTLEYSIYWLLAVEHQGARVIDAWNIKEGQNYPFLNTRTIEEHFYLVACNKARRWVTKLKPIIEDNEPIVEFLENTNNSKIVRDKREHDDEYFGTGKKYQEEPNHDVSSKSAIKMNVGTSCSVQTDGKLLLGGIFDVYEGIQSAKLLQEYLRPFQHAYWDKRAIKKGGCDHFKIPNKLFGS